MGIEKRKTARYPYRANLDVLTKKPPSNEPAACVNLSAGGVCFEYPLPIKSADKVTVRFPAKEPLELAAEVRWVTKVSTEIGGEEIGAMWIVGAEFSGATSAQRQRIENMLASLAAEAAGRPAPQTDEEEW